MSGGESRVRCGKEEHCIGTWNVRSMNHGKLDMAKKMTTVNINSLGISELKRTGLNEFNSDYHYIIHCIYYCGQESLRRNGVSLTVKRESEMQFLGAILKMIE